MPVINYLTSVQISV